MKVVPIYWLVTPCGRRAVYSYSQEGRMKRRGLEVMMATPLIVGRYYWVQCIEITPRPDVAETLWLPIFGPPHHDDSDVNPDPAFADRWHVHFDMRFIGPDELKVMGFAESALGTAIIGPGRGYHKSEVTSVQIEPVEAFCTDSKPICLVTRWAYRRCLRQWPVREALADERRYRFEARFQNSVLDLRHPICPHKGFDLSTVAHNFIKGRRRIVCPGHSLQWCATTGHLVSQTRVK